MKLILQCDCGVHTAVNSNYSRDDGLYLPTTVGIECTGIETVEINDKTLDVTRKTTRMFVECPSCARQMVYPLLDGSSPV